MTSMLKRVTREEHEELYRAALTGVSEVAGEMERIGLGNREECRRAATVFRKVLLSAGEEGEEPRLWRSRLVPDHGADACSGCGAAPGPGEEVLDNPTREEVGEKAAVRAEAGEIPSGQCPACGRITWAVGSVEPERRR